MQDGWWLPASAGYWPWCGLLTACCRHTLALGLDTYNLMSPANQYLLSAERCSSPATTMERIKGGPLHLYLHNVYKRFTRRLWNDFSLFQLNALIPVNISIFLRFFNRYYEIDSFLNYFPPKNQPSRGPIGSDPSRPRNKSHADSAMIDAAVQSCWWIGSNQARNTFVRCLIRRRKKFY